jgi:hypothetical protein
LRIAQHAEQQMIWADLVPTKSAGFPGGQLKRAFSHQWLAR